MSPRAAVGHGDRIEVTVACRQDPAGDPFVEPELVTETVVIDEVTVMACGCTRAGFDRPGPWGWETPRVHVFSPGCRFVDPDQTVDFDVARAAARSMTHDEAHDAIARRLLHSAQLVAVYFNYRGSREQVRSEITSSSRAMHGGGHAYEVSGRDVAYRWHGAEGKVKITDLLEVAASYGTPGKVARLRCAHRAWLTATLAEQEFTHPDGLTAAKRASARWEQLRSATFDAAGVLRWVEKTWWQPEDRWQAALDALRLAVIPADVPAALAFYADELTAEHHALAAFVRTQLREEVAAA